MSFNSQIKGNIDNFFTSTKKLGATVSRIPVTKTLNEFSGQETLTEGTSASIVCYFTNNYKANNKWFISEEGQVQSGDAFIMVKSTQALNKDDVIVYDSKRFRVRNIYRLIVNNTLVGVQGNLFLIEK